MMMEMTPTPTKEKIIMIVLPKSVKGVISPKPTVDSAADYGKQELKKLEIK